MKIKAKLIPQLLTVIDMPIKFGGRLVLKLPEDFTKSDIRKVKKWFKAILKTRTIYTTKS